MFACHAVLLSALLLLLDPVLADLNCSEYIVKGSKGNSARINFYGQNNLSYIPSTNLTVGDPVFLDTGADTLGTIFKFEICTSNSLNLGPSEFSYGPGPDCYTDYSDPIRIISPTSGDCLTIRPSSENRSVSVIYPKTCESNPTNLDQFFAADQRVDYYYCHYKKPHYHPPVFFPLYFSPYYPYDGSAINNTPWTVGMNSKTVHFNPPSDIGVPNCLHGTILSLNA